MPWRNSHPVVNRLGLILPIILIWDLVLEVDNNLLPGWYHPMILVTVAIYPLLTLATISLLRVHHWSWMPQRLGARLLQGAPLLFTLGLLIVATQVPAFLGAKANSQTDASASIACAAQDVIHGRDPYLTPELACLHRFNIGAMVATPLQRGPLAGFHAAPTNRQLQPIVQAASHHAYHSAAFPEFGYPPMSYVWLLPVAGGNHGEVVAWMLIGVMLWLALVITFSGKLWPAAVLLMLLQVDNNGLISGAIKGDAEFFCYALMALSLICIDKAKTSATFMGLAIATNPLAWVVGVGYFFFIFKMNNVRSRFIWLFATPIVLCLPWLILEPKAMTGIIDLIRQPTFASGVGVIMLFGAAPASILRFVLTLVSMGSMVLTEIVLQWRKEWWYILPVIPTAFFWFSWRSNPAYLNEVFVLAVAMMVGMYRLARQDVIPTTSDTFAV